MPEMKDSGIDAIGQIPISWKETRLKYRYLDLRNNKVKENFKV